MSNDYVKKILFAVQHNHFIQKRLMVLHLLQIFHNIHCDPNMNFVITGRLWSTLFDYTQVVSLPTHLGGSLLHNVYIKLLLFWKQMILSCQLSAISFRSRCYLSRYNKTGKNRFLEFLKLTDDVHVSVDNLDRGTVDTALSVYSYDCIILNKGAKFSHQRVKGNELTPGYDETKYWEKCKSMNIKQYICYGTYVSQVFSFFVSLFLSLLFCTKLFNFPNNMNNRKDICRTIKCLVDKASTINHLYEKLPDSILLIYIPLNSFSRLRNLLF